MKFKEPSSTSLIDTATSLGGFVGGGAISKGIFGLIHEDKTGTPEEIKKHQNIGLAKRAGLIAVAVIGAAAIDGKDALTMAVKSAMVGVAGVQALEVVKDFSAKSTSVQNLAVSGKTAQKFVARSLGLGCPCDSTLQQSMLNGARKRSRRGLKFAQPVYAESFAPTPEPVFMGGNSFDAYVDKGASMSA